MTSEQTVSTNCLILPDFDIRFTERDLTANGSSVLLRKFLDTIKLRSAYVNWNIPLPGSGRGYDPGQLIKQFIVSVWSGAEHFTHCEQVRNDKVILCLSVNNRLRKSFVSMWKLQAIPY